MYYNVNNSIFTQVFFCCVFLFILLFMNLFIWYFVLQIVVVYTFPEQVQPLFSCCTQCWWWWLLPCMQEFRGKSDDPIPGCFFFFSDQLVHTNPLFCPGWVHSGSVSWDDWPSIFWWVACELVSMIGSHTMPGLHSQPTPTLLGQGCMHV